jgi:hypothetical protein
MGMALADDTLSGILFGHEMEVLCEQAQFMLGGPDLSEVEAQARPRPGVHRDCCLAVAAAPRLAVRGMGLVGVLLRA